MRLIQCLLVLSAGFTTIAEATYSLNSGPCGVGDILPDADLVAVGTTGVSIGGAEYPYRLQAFTIERVLAMQEIPSELNEPSEFTDKLVYIREDLKQESPAIFPSSKYLLILRLAPASDGEMKAFGISGAYTFATLGLCSAIPLDLSSHYEYFDLLRDKLGVDMPRDQKVIEEFQFGSAEQLVKSVGELAAIAFLDVRDRGNALDDLATHADLLQAAAIPELRKALAKDEIIEKVQRFAKVVNSANPGKVTYFDFRSVSNRSTYRVVLKDVGSFIVDANTGLVCQFDRKYQDTFSTVEGSALSDEGAVALARPVFKYYGLQDSQFVRRVLPEARGYGWVVEFRLKQKKDAMDGAVVLSVFVAHSGGIARVSYDVWIENANDGIVQDADDQRHGSDAEEPTSPAN